ncbi:MAG: response regulator transcription factor [Desulfobacterales bacterium]|nr:response regulator transcription factor [Desulfobacterales bacterium]
MIQNKIRILLADDHTIVREGLINILKAVPGFDIIGEASNGREAVRMADELRPDIILMDIAMPELNGVEATRQIMKTNPEIKIIILSMHSNERFISEVFSMKASGYLLKDSSGSEIIKAIRAVLNGKTYMSPAVSRKLVDEYISLKDGKPRTEDLYDKLTNREREVFQMIAEGKSTREIATILCVSISTIKTHRTNITDKLKMDNISQLIRFAIDLGIVDL